ncbi:putative oxidoreductase protein [Rhizobium freirei PRF 81]|uniref:Putative oxidoreductase protein n=1 Tax=Rhizobium freirei PRF 81 TaxID=363754 RepID=N6U199_9HYPH|nr:oxidoreductase [Rhizobium freirei]ENN84118.1 putative oxidoreductase protein [Rhizobium freirei PRF 81]
MSRSHGFTEANVPNQSGKCFIVTGANTGIGFEASRVLAARGARVLLACRDKAKAETAMAAIRQQAPKANLAFLPLDQADLASVKAAAELAALEPRIDVLINNAGVMTPPMTRTKQGFELQLGVNHLGTFALTSLLLPKLAETQGSRVVVTSSIAHRNAKIDWDDLNAERSYSRVSRYAASKLANALFFFELDRRLRAAGSPIAAVGCHPGAAATELGRYLGPLQLLLPLARLLLNTAAMGAWPTLQAATAPVTSGDYYGPMGFREIRGVSGKASRSARAQDAAAAKRLWDVSVAMTGIDPGLPPA